jgi:hypothetical protein
MSDITTVMESAETADVQPPTPSRLVAASEPAGTVVESLLAALRRGEITSKFAREVLVRALPPSKRTVQIKGLPKVVDARSYARAAQRVAAAAASGEIAPEDAATMMRVLKGAFEAACRARTARAAGL